MISLASEVVRELPAPPIFFGLFSFGSISGLLALFSSTPRQRLI